MRIRDVRQQGKSHGTTGLWRMATTVAAVFSARRRFTGLTLSHAHYDAGELRRGGYQAWSAVEKSEA